MRRHCLVLAAGLAGFASTSIAAEQPQHRLAFSKRMGVEVLAGMRGGHWCREALELEVRAQDRQLFVRDDFHRLMRQIGALIEKDCSEAKTALLKGTGADGRTSVYQGQTSKIDRWTPHVLKAGGDEQKSPEAADQKKAQAPSHQAPQAAPKAEPQQHMTTASPQVVAAPSPPPPPSPPPLPRDVNYASAMIRLVKDNPSLAQDEGVLRCWAEYRFGNEYSRFRKQEFKLQPVLEKAQTDLAATLVDNDGQHVTAIIAASFGSYDFDTQQFPISLNLEGVTFRRDCNTSSGDVPPTLTVKIPDLGAITGLPMDREAAGIFAEKRTQYGSVDRGIAIAMTIRLDDGGFVKGSSGRTVATGILESATIFADSGTTQPLYWLAPAELEKTRAARAAEKAAIAKAKEERKGIEGDRPSASRTKRSASASQAKAASQSRTFESESVPSSTAGHTPISPQNAGSPNSKQSTMTPSPVNNDGTSALIYIAIATLVVMGAGVLVSFRRRHVSDLPRPDTDGSVDSGSTQEISEVPDPHLVEDVETARQIADAMAASLLRDTKQCPACFSQIPRPATVCSSCGERMTVDLQNEKNQIKDLLVGRIRFCGGKPVYVLPDGAGFIVGGYLKKSEDSIAALIEYMDATAPPGTLDHFDPSVIAQNDPALASCGIQTGRASDAASGMPASLSSIAATGVATPVQAEETPQKKGGLILPILGCCAGFVSIFAWAIVFAPLGALFSLIGLFAGMHNKRTEAIGLSLLGILLTVIGIATSPIFALLGIFAF